MTIELLPPDQVADFYAWRGGGETGSYLDLALDGAILDYLASGRWIFVALEADGEWSGTVSLELFHDDAELANGETRVYLSALEVPVKERRRGIATRLVQHVVSFAREREFSLLTLAVEPQKFEAQAFYRAQGFTKFKATTLAAVDETVAVDCLCLPLKD